VSPCFAREVGLICRDGLQRRRVSSRLRRGSSETSWQADTGLAGSAPSSPQFAKSPDTEPYLNMDSYISLGPISVSEDEAFTSSKPRQVGGHYGTSGNMPASDMSHIR
jgi:hypothetical protein